MRAIFRFVILLVTLPVLVAGSYAAAEEPKAAKAAKESKTKKSDSKKTPRKSRPGITISKETTYVLGPLTDEGYVDYVKALNDHASQGVTPKNNAAVSLIKAIGPGSLYGTSDQQRYFKLLGIAPLPVKGDYFVFLVDFVKQLEDELTIDKIIELEKVAMEKPWPKEQYPILAKWLEANEKPLKTLTEGLKRPLFYSPYIAPQDSNYVQIPMPLIIESRSLANALRMRSMLKLHSGNIAGAQRDLLDCHRLARLAGQGVSYMESQAAFGIDKSAFSGDVTIAHYGKLSLNQTKDYWADLKKLSPLPKMSDKINFYDRLGFLNMVCLIKRKGPDSLSEIDGRPKIKKGTFRYRLAKSVFNASLDWDEMLRMGNSHFDLLAEACKKTSRKDRNESLEKIISDFRKKRTTKTGLESAVNSAFEIALSPRKRSSKKVVATYFSFFFLTTRLMMQAQDRADVQFELAHAALALGAYHTDHGAYPEKLTKLVPKYLDKVPQDVFADRPLKYKKQAKGYILYSIGPNEKDDGGRDYDSEPEGDDITIRTPAETQ